MHLSDFEHGEDYYAPIVKDYILANGIGYWNDIFNYVEKNIPLDSEDFSLYDDGSIIYQRILRNIKSHKSLLVYGNIIHVQDGFATIEYAKEHNIEEQISGSGSKGKKKRITKKEKHANAVHLFETYYYSQNHKNDFSDSQQIKVHMNKEKVYQLILSGKNVEEAIAKIL